MQVLLNLLNNALKFTTAGEIVVDIAATEVRRDRAELRFSVRDTGIGIAEADQQMLFEPFTQVDGTMTRRFGGMGLGLAISRRLVRMMGGDMNVQSDVGVGSTFTFSAQFDLPRGAVGARRLADEFRDLPVLVADDNVSARTVIASMLRSLSCAVTAVDSGDAAVMEAERAARSGQPYRLAVLDWKVEVGCQGTPVAEEAADRPWVAAVVPGGEPLGASVGDRHRLLTGRGLGEPGSGSAATRAPPASTAKTLRAIEVYGVERMLTELRELLERGRYRPQAARRVYTPTPVSRRNAGP